MIYEVKRKKNWNKEKLLGEWMLAVCGGYDGEELEHCGHIFSNMEKYNDKTAIEDATAIVEEIRAYWMERARKQEEFQNKFKANTAFRTQEEISAEEIESQFVKTEERYFLTVGEIDCPTGKIVVADPLAYLPSAQFSPVLAKNIPIGKYPVEVSICRQNDIGLRMCTARLKIKDTKAVKYKKTTATDESVYDDYFASYFAESYKMLPAYQREGGEFIEWMNPESGNKLVMIASGFGDGFYNSYYGYDSEDAICQNIVPMINPSIF